MHNGKHWVVANDGNGNHFDALTSHPDPKPEQHVPVWIYIEGENGWQANVGALSLQQLKKLDDGTFGA